MRFRPLHFLLTLVVFIVIGAVSTINAQTLPPTSGLILSVSDETPSAGQTVTITARSFSFEINTANMTWLVDGKTTARGIGLTQLDVTAPATGKKRSVNVTATTPQGRTYTSTVSIGSASVDMILETDGYVPSFFRGKAPVAYQNKVKVTAIPHLATTAGVEYAANNLIYTWSRNGTILEAQSGYGKQSLVLVGDIVPRDYTLNVEVRSRDNAARAEGDILISAKPPSIIFYNEDPLYGPFFHKSIFDTIRIGTEKEIGIRAVPFGFSRPSNESLSFNWRINGVERPELSGNESLVLRTQENTVGISSIRLSIRNLDNILQGSEADFSAIFTANAPEDTNNLVTF